MQFFKRKIWRVTAALLVMAACIPVSLRAAGKQQQEFVIVIDAGHGGKDTGAAENGAQEKDINLGVALKLGEMIKSKLKDTKVIYTRETDKFISLQGRADIANKNNADLFVSIHTNSADKSNPGRANVSGASSWIMSTEKDAKNLEVAKRENDVIKFDENDRKKFGSEAASIHTQMVQQKNREHSARMASYVQDEMIKIGRNVHGNNESKGVKEAGFYVLWSTAAPSVLIELDFICNPEQARFLNSKEGQEKLAGAIFNAVKSYETYYRDYSGKLAKEEKKRNSGKDAGKDADAGYETAQETKKAKNEKRPNDSGTTSIIKQSAIEEQVEAYKKNNNANTDKGSRAPKNNQEQAEGGEVAQAFDDDDADWEMPEGQEKIAANRRSRKSSQARKSNPTRRRRVIENDGDDSTVVLAVAENTAETSQNAGVGPADRKSMKADPNNKPKQLTKDEKKAVEKAAKEAEKKKKEDEKIAAREAREAEKKAKQDAKLAEKKAREDAKRKEEEEKLAKYTKGKTTQKPVETAQTAPEVEEDTSAPVVEQELPSVRKRVRARKQTITTEYRILLHTTPTRVSLSDKIFNGYQVEEIQEYNTYKYTYGKGSSRSDLNELLAEVRQKFPQAEIIELKITE